MKLGEVIFAVNGTLIPGHGPLEHIHGKSCALRISGVDMDRKSNTAPRSRYEFVTNSVEHAGDEGKQIAWLGVGIAPDQKVTPLGRQAGLNQVTIRQQRWVLPLIGFDANNEARKYVGPIQGKGDAPESL